MPWSEVDLLKTLPLARIRSAVSAGCEHVSQFFRLPTHARDAELAKLLWLVRMRWVAIALFSVLSVPALLSGVLSRDKMPLFLGVIGILFVFNFLTQTTATERGPAANPLRICFQMAFDLAALTVLLLLTGGAGNPFVALFLLHAALGGLLISNRLSRPFLLLTHAALGFLQLEFVTSPAAPPEIEPRLLALFAVSQLLVFSFWFVLRSWGDHFERQAEQRSQTRMQLERQDRLRAIGALSAGFSHEFASPLNAAKIRLERLARKQASEDVLEALDAVHACETVVRRMNSSQLDHRDFQFKTVVIRDLLRDVLDSWQEEHPDSRIVPRLDDASRGAVPPVNFAQVILNLLDNAAEAAPGRDIDVALSGSETHFLLEVSDRGPGFSETVLRRFGEPFLTTKAGGTGLGLYVSQLFCQSLGGALTVENLPAGALVRLSWPKQGGFA